MFRNILILFFVLLISVSALKADNTEFRAVWVITWDYISDSRTASQNKAKIRKILDNVKAANMNAVLWQVRQSGAVYFNSSYEPYGYYAGYSYPGFDPLAYAVAEAHKRGLELHAWFNTFQVYSTHAGTPAAEHPEWICTNRDGAAMTSHRCVSPGLDEVRDYTLKVAMEVVNNYDIDGLHLDYIRWNEFDEDDMQNPPSIEQEMHELDGMFSEEKINGLAKTAGSKRYIFDKQHPYSGGVPSGYSNWDDWRRDGVTAFVHALHDSIQAVKPWVRLSPAALGKYKKGGTSGWNGYYIVFQDAAKWFNEGYIDQLTPMHYHWLNGTDMKDELTSDWKPYLSAGIAEGRLYTNGPGSYILDENGVWGNHVDIVNKVRTLSWVDGFQFFSYSSWQKYHYWETAGSTFFGNRTKVRPARFLSTEIPPAPALELSKIDSMNYQITVTPADTLQTNQWFAVYRSADSLLNTDQDEIIQIRYAKQPFTVTDSYWGQERIEGRYTYFATMLNRFWNESDISNAAAGDSVPNFVNPPDAPEYVRILQVDANTLAVECDSAARADEYIAYYGTDGVTFSDSAVSHSSRILVNGLVEGAPYYFKIRTRNTSGSSEFPKHLFAGATSADPEVLIVNGFDRSTNTKFDYIKRYAVPVTDRGYGFSYCLNESVYKGKVHLRDFKTVIWILGDESTADETFSQTEEDSVAKFLKKGGNLFVSGSEIGWDLDYKGSSYDKSFYHNYLKAQYAADAPDGKKATFYSCTAIPGQLFDGLDDFSFDNGTHGTFDVDWPDAITPYNGSEAFLQYKNATDKNIAAVAFEGVFPGGTEKGKLINSGVPFETIYPESKRISFMARVFDFFEGKISGVEEGRILPEAFKVGQNYPNPFNPVTTIPFTLAKAGKVTINIYNMLGQKKTLVKNRFFTSGRHKILWDGTGFASGTYIYEVIAGNKHLRKKMILLK